MKLTSLTFKCVTIIGIATMLLSSCGNKLYSYRKTVRVKSEVTKVQPKPSEAKIYITVQEVKPTRVVSKPTSMVELNVDENTIYNTTKPLPEKEVATIGIVSPIFGATIR
jgi:hypothetical protein